MKHAVRATFAVAFLVVSAFCQPEQLSGLDAFVQQSLKTFEVPGIGVAVVKDGEIVLAKGYGVRKLGESAAVDSHTLLRVVAEDGQPPVIITAYRTSKIEKYWSAE